MASVQLLDGERLDGEPPAFVATTALRECATAAPTVATLPHLPTLNALRGIAATAVCWFHFTNGNSTFLPDGALKSSGQYGWLGVQVFFVISGFVIPYALASARYQLRDYPRFLLKRIVRLDPPFLASIILALILSYFASLLPGHKGESFSVNVPALLLHLGYLNALVGYPWLNAVYWTLAIEFQYYILIGVVYPLLMWRSRAGRGLVPVAASAVALIGWPESCVLHHLPLFMLGASSCQFRLREVSLSTWAAQVSAIIVIGSLAVGHLELLAGVVTTAIILFVRLQSPLLQTLGNLSYALYLLHTLLGLRVINLSARLTTSLEGRACALAVAFLVTLLGSFVFYLFIEGPSRRWSSAIKYSRTEVA